jgi:hypothetical protein
MPNPLFNAMFPQYQQIAEQEKLMNALNAQRMVDLGRIPVVGKAQSAMQGPQMPEGFGVRGGTPEPKNLPRAKGNSATPPAWASLIPLLAATGVGLVNKNMLAGAAGFNTGYAGGLDKEADRKLKKEQMDRMSPTYTYDPDTGEYKETGVSVPRGAQIRNLTSKDKMNLLSQILSPEELGSLNLGDKSTEDITKGVKDPYVKPANIPESVWNSTSDQQKKEYFETLNVR